MKDVVRSVSGTALLIAAAAVGLLQLVSCSTRGGAVLHNASGEPVELSVFSDFYEFSVNETREVRVDPVFGGERFSIRMSRGTLCYEMAAVDPKWIEPGVFHARVFGSLDRNARIFLFPPQSGEKGLQEGQPPPQPNGFPLAPLPTDQC